MSGMPAILWYGGSTVKPGVPLGRMIALISAEPLGLVPVRAVTETTLVIGVPALVMKAFDLLDDPLPVPSRAVVAVAPASEPASGSGQAEAGQGRVRRRGRAASALLVAAEGEDRVDAQADPGRQGDADRLVDPAELPMATQR